MNEPTFENTTLSVENASVSAEAETAARDAETAAREAAQSAREREARRSLSRLGLALAAFSLLPQIVATLLYWLVPYVFPEWVESDWFLWAVQVFCLYIVGLCAFFLILGRKPLPAVATPREPFSFFRLFRLFSIMMACALAGSLISTVLSTLARVFVRLPVTDTTSEILLSSSPVYLFLVVVVIGPIVEELVYRYAVMRVLLPYGERGAILFSGLIFGLIHGNLFQLFYAFALGVLLSFLYSRTGKLRYPILLHMLFNFFGGFLPALLTQILPMDELTGGAATLETILASLFPILGLLLYELLYFGLAVTGLIFFLLCCTRTRFYPATSPLRRGAWEKAHLFSAGMIAFFAVSFVLLVLSLF